MCTPPQTSSADRVVRTSRGPPDRRTAAWISENSLMPNLRGGRTVLVNFAVAALPHKASVGIHVAPQRARRQYVRLHQDLRVFNGDVVQDGIALAREFLDDVHPIGVEEPAAPQPSRIDERDGVEHQRVALPASDGAPQVRDIELRFLGVGAAIGWDYPVLAVSAPRIASKVEKVHIFLRLVDASRWALPRDSQRLAGHDRVVLVGPHVELLNLVPVLRLVEWTIQIAKPRGRVELEVFSLIGLAVAT